MTLYFNPEQFIEFLRPVHQENLITALPSDIKTPPELKIILEQQRKAKLKPGIKPLKLAKPNPATLPLQLTRRQRENPMWVAKPNPDVLRVIALDPGENIGGSISDMYDVFAYAIFFWKHDEHQMMIDFLKSYIKYENVGGIVIGFPWDANSSGYVTYNPSSRGDTWTLLDELTEKLPSILPIIIQDESFSTKEAEVVFEAEYVSRNIDPSDEDKRKEIMDSLEARIILQRFLSLNHLLMQKVVPKKRLYCTEPIDPVAVFGTNPCNYPPVLLKQKSTLEYLEKALRATGSTGVAHVNTDPEQVKSEDVVGVKEKDICPVVDIENEADDRKKRHLNCVFIGHVDSGKSTIAQKLLFLGGQVDDRTIQKYEKEAKGKTRESLYMAYIKDTNEEESAKAKIVEVGRDHFETEATRFTILDSPGHKGNVPNMISGASQADIGVLVISARKGEFETGYGIGGQTFEHLQVADILGISKLLVVVNKMDEPSVKWSKERFDEIESKMITFLKSSGFDVEKDVQFLPISGLTGTNMKTRLDKTVCPWWSGPSLFEALDSIEVPLRDTKGAFRMPIIDKLKDMGTVVMGKIESGSIREGDNLMIMPNKVQVKVLSIFIDQDKVRHAGPGENLRVRVSGIEEGDILRGSVLCSFAKPIHAVNEFIAQLQILHSLDSAIFSAGYKSVLHIHDAVDDCEILELLAVMDPNTKKPMKKKPLFVKKGGLIVCRVQVKNLICVEKYSDFPQLGRFTLRTEGKTIAVGKVTELSCAEFV